MTMGRNMKKAGILLMAGIMLCSTVSCGRKTEKIQLADSEQEPEYLSLFSIDSLSGSSVAKYWSDRFAEEYKRQVYIDFDEASYYSEQGLSYRELLEKRLNSSTPDDLYIINAEDVMDFEKKGYWMDLSGIDAVGNLTDAALYQSTYNGKVFSIPLSFTGFGFYWNLDMLKEHGLFVPQNLEEFLKVCEKLKAKGILPYGANKGSALTVPAMCTGMSELYGSSERERLIDELNSGAIGLGSYMREGFQFLAMLIEKGYMDPKQALSVSPGEEIDMFLKGECAFICAGLGTFTSMDTEKRGFEMKMTGLPVLAEGCIAVYGGDLRLCVNPNSRHLDTALEFIEMVGTPKALEKSAELDGTMSSAKESEMNEFCPQKEMYQLLRQPGQIPNQDFTLHFNTWENIRDISREICQGMSVDEACRKLDEKQNAELEEYAGAQ